MKTRISRTPDDVRNVLKKIGFFALALLFVCSLLGMGGGAVMAYTPPGVPVDGPVTDQVTKEEVAGLNATSVSKLITKIRPSDVPLNHILREIGSAEDTDGKSFEVKYYQSSMRPTNALITAATVQTTGQVDISVDVPKNFGIHYSLIVRGVTNTAGADIRLFVTKKNNSASTVSVIAVNGDLSVPTDPASNTIIPAIPANTRLYAIGIAKNELDASTDPMEMLPTPSTNYQQLYMCQVEQGVYDEMSKKDGDINYGMLDFKADAIYMMKMLEDLTTLYGTKAVRYNPETDKVHYFSSGLIENVGVVKTYSLSNPALGINKEWVNSLTREVFSETNGSDSRIFFVSPNLMERLQNVDFIQKQIEANKSEAIFGIKFSVIDTAFGTMYLKVHKGLDLAGDPDGGFVIDPKNIRRRDFSSAKWTKLDYDKTGIAKVDAWRLEESFCCEFRNVLAHAYILAQP